MKRYAVILFGLCCCKSALSDSSRAVESMHYQAGISFSRANLDPNGNIKTWGANGALTLPLAQYFGASLSGMYNQARVEIDPISCRPEASGLTAGLFIRDYEKGKFGVSYGESHADSCTFSSTSGNSTRSTQSDHTTVAASYYLPSWTVNASRSRTVQKGDLVDQTSYVSSFGATFYPTSNLSVSLAADRRDPDDSYRLQFEFQPSLLGNSASLTAGYLWDPDSRTISIGATYYFDKRPELIVRDRHYR